MHSLPALVQFEHGLFLSHRTFLLLHVVHDFGFKCEVEEALFEGDVGDS